MQALQKLGHPYTAKDVAESAAVVKGKTELDALVAYLQGLGLHVK
jgi:cytochrome c oxidase cbb3-type subunit 2